MRARPTASHYLDVVVEHFQAARVQNLEQRRAAGGRLGGFQVSLLQVLLPLRLRFPVRHRRKFAAPGRPHHCAKFREIHL